MDKESKDNLAKIANLDEVPGGEVYKMLRALQEKYFTGSIVLHLSEGDFRKVETTQVERFPN